MWRAGRERRGGEDDDVDVELNRLKGSQELCWAMPGAPRICDSSGDGADDERKMLRIADPDLNNGMTGDDILLYI